MSIISSILDEYNITLGNLVDTIKSIIKENTVLKLRNKVSEVLNSKIDLINYAISQFEGKNYNRIIFNFNIKRYDEDALLVVREVNKIINDKYEDTYFVTEGSVFVDFEDAFVYDSLTINILSFIFILLIIALSFRSIIVPLILTILIEGAIWTTLGISFLSGERQYFICYLMVVCIQMGTTIDYGILLTSKYIEERKTNDKITSIKHAYFDSLPTILTSGLILIFASFIVGEVSEVSIISSIGFLLCKGSIISIAFIILALSQILLICDKLIIKKPKQK